jgi:hypothetical protein
VVTLASHLRLPFMFGPVRGGRVLENLVAMS